MGRGSPSRRRALPVVRPIELDGEELQASLDALVRTYAQRGRSLHSNTGPDRFAVISEQRPADGGRCRVQMAVQCYPFAADAATSVAQMAALECGADAAYELSPVARFAPLFISRRAVILSKIDAQQASTRTIKAHGQRLRSLHPDIEANTAVVLDGDKRFVAVTGRPARVALTWAALPNCDQISAFVSRPEAIVGVYDLGDASGLKCLRIRIEVRIWGAAISGRGHYVI